MDSLQDSDYSMMVANAFLETFPHRGQKVHVVWEDRQVLSASEDEGRLVLDSVIPRL